jgi:hypothetical protein
MMAYREASLEQAADVRPDDVPFGFKEINGDII